VSAAGDTEAPVGGGARFDVQRPEAGTINNVGRDQYLSYVTHVQQQRDSFARDIAATKTRGSWLAWIGLAIYVVGFLVYAQVILRFIALIWDSMAGKGQPDFSSLNGGPGGVAGIAIGFLAAFVGTVMLIVGIVLHVVAAARRRRMDQQFPLPSPPWTGPPGRSAS
jgi:hypothetical protein